MMRDLALTRGWSAAFDQISWLDEAIARREWRRTLRQTASGRWAGLFTLTTLALWLPALSTGTYTAEALLRRDWPFASLGIAICLCGFATAFLRASQIWGAEARGLSLEAWLISRQRTQAVAVTVVLAAAVPTLIMSLPAFALLLLTALRSEGGLGLLPAVLAFYVVAVAAGGALGSALSFLQTRAWPSRPARIGAVLLGMLVLVLWLRIEYVGGGWLGAWRPQFGRFLFVLFLLTPIPHLIGITSPDLWRVFWVPRLGYPLPPGVTLALLALLYAGAVAYCTVLSARGFQLLRDDPERLSRHRETAEPVPESGAEYYWSGFRNPIWTREIRTRLRGREAVECIFVSSLAIAVGGFFPLLAAGSQLGDPLQMAAVARQVFQWLALTLGAFVALLTPGLTAEAITGERERGTLDLLLCSPLRPREILHGKLLGAVSILVLLLSPSLPLFGVCTVFHGASLSEVIGVYLALGILTAGCAYIGVTASAMHRQMVHAKLQAYLLSLLFSSLVFGLASLAFGTAQSRGLSVVVTVLVPMAGTLCMFVAAILWGHATERLQYVEPEAP